MFAFFAAPLTSSSFSLVSGIGDCLPGSIEAFLLAEVAVLSFSPAVSSQLSYAVFSSRPSAFPLPVACAASLASNFLGNGPRVRPRSDADPLTGGESTMVGAGSGTCRVDAVDLMVFAEGLRPATLTTGE